MVRAEMGQFAQVTTCMSEQQKANLTPTSAIESNSQHMRTRYTLPSVGCVSPQDIDEHRLSLELYCRFDCLCPRLSIRRRLVSPHFRSCRHCRSFPCTQFLGSLAGGRRQHGYGRSLALKQHTASLQARLGPLIGSDQIVAEWAQCSHDRNTRTQA